MEGRGLLQRNKNAFNGEFELLSKERIEYGKEQWEGLGVVWLRADTRLNSGDSVSINQTSKWHIPPTVSLGHLGTGWCRLIRMVWLAEVSTDTDTVNCTIYGWIKDDHARSVLAICLWPCHLAGAHRLSFILVSAMLAIFMSVVFQVAMD